VQILNQIKIEELRIFMGRITLCKSMLLRQTNQVETGICLNGIGRMMVIIGITHKLQQPLNEPAKTNKQT
jgi:hypothetical protein